MAYINANFQWTKDDVRSMDTIEDENNIPIETLVGVHYAYHKNDADFDGGLNFLDLLFKKLNKPFKLNWNVEEMKNQIRNSDNPQMAYLDLLRNILTTDMTAYYGL